MEITQNNINQVVAALKAGKPAIFPTDTVYGLGLSVEHAEDLQQIYDLKQRDQGKPIAWLVDSLEALETYGRAVPEFAFALARMFWPGALTLIVNASEAVPPAFCAKDGTVALRMPASETALNLIGKVGAPLATTSANISGQNPPRTFETIDTALLSQVSAVLRDESQKTGIASTLIDCTNGHPILVREGSISIADIQALV